MDISAKKLGENIRAARTRRGISAEALAERLGVSVRTVRSYETAERTVDVPMLVRLAVALGCSLQTLMQGLDPRVIGDAGFEEYKILTAEEHEVFRHMATTWDGDRASLITFIALYMALPVRYRREAPLSLLAQMELAIKDGAVSREDLPQGIERMEERWRKMYE